MRWQELVVISWSVLSLVLHLCAAAGGKYNPAPELTLREVWIEFFHDPMRVLQLAITVAGCAFIIWAY